VNILLDECVPWPMHKFLADHHCTTAQKRGWGGIENGELLRLAEGEYDLFITSDQNVRYQQNLTGRKIAVLELSTNDIHRIQAAASAIQNRVKAIQLGDFVKLSIP
jgi:predicted nuclease of predicted toxin-antitoxin system